MSDGPTLVAPLARLDEASHVAEVSALFARCADYFLLQDGEPATEQDARELFTEIPPGRLAGELVVFGRHGAIGLDAVAALLQDHPATGSWYLPFMLVDPAVRGRGLGSALHAQVARWASLPGAHRLQLVVLDGNEGGAAFWYRLGYRTIGRVGPHPFKSRWHHRIEMALDLAAA